MPEVIRNGVTLRAAGVVCPGSCKDDIARQDIEAVDSHDREQTRQAKRCERISKVRLVSVNYGGPQQPIVGHTLETDWYSEKHEAEEAARLQAVDHHDVDTIWYVKIISERFPGTSPNGRQYFYLQWKVIGEV